MVDATLSRLFERYRAENDLAALAEVFDRVSPDLLRVARHVAGRGVEPEDLLQATFLAAIERSSTFDAERPLLPWLLGILVNQSRRARRHESRTLAEDSEGAIPARPDHEHDAESHEIDAAVTRALAELPARYREVLVPHLSEGKDPHVIARELGRPQGTVRAQIHRGIRLMRRMLPSSYALGGFALPATDPLIRVRDRVLSEGARRIGRPDLLTELAKRRAARAMRRRTTTIGAAGVLGVAVWLSWPASETQAVEPGSVARTSSLVTAPDRTSLDETSMGSERTPRDADAPPDPAASIAAEYGSVVVNVRESETDLPAAGARISLIAWGAPRWFENVREARSDARGVARFDHVQAGRVAVHVERGEQSRSTVAANAETSFVVRTPPTIALELEVREPNGAPIAGAVIDVHARRDEPPSATSAPTDAQGRVRVEHAPNECFVSARSAGHVTSNMAWAGRRTTNFDEPSRFVFELSTGGIELEGQVVDERGVSIAGAGVVVASAVKADGPTWRPDGSPSFEKAPRATETDAAGRFRIDGLDHASLRLCVESSGHATHVARIAPVDGRFAFETVQLGRSAGLRGVARLVDGSPAKTARVEVLVGGEVVRDTRSDLDGSYAMTGLPRGRATLRARAGLYGQLSTLDVVLDPDATLEWDPKLVGAETIEGRAIGQDGRPISTWLVLATPEDTAADPAQRLAQWSREQVPAPVEDLALQSWIYSNGVFVVPCRSSAMHRIELRARAAWRDPPQTYVTGVRPGARDVVLRVVRERGHIQGRFVDGTGRPAPMSRVIAIASGSTGELVGTIDPHTGRFDVETLAGTHQLVAWSRTGTLYRFGAVDVSKPTVVDLGDEIVSAPGALEFRALDFEPSERELIDAGGLSFELLPSAPRTWNARSLQPGAYLLRATLPNGTKRELTVEVHAGETTRAILAAE